MLSLRGKRNELEAEVPSSKSKRTKAVAIQVFLAQRFTLKDKIKGKEKENILTMQEWTESIK